MYEISFNDFRGFREQNFVKVRPLTVLVGENSSGKSSFLAGLKYALDLLKYGSEPSFNDDPFQLGTFQQIAHYRDGKGNETNEFRISIKAEAKIVPSHSRKKNEIIPFELNISFNDSESQAVISSIKFSSGSDTLQMAKSPDGIRIYHIGRRGKRTSLNSEMPFPLKQFELPGMLFHFLEYSFRFERFGRNKDSEGPDEKIKNSMIRLTRITNALRYTFNENVRATSAIRTKPSRTYTPGSESQDSEGTHVPFEIAKLYRRRAKNSAEWQSFKSSIEGFGSASGMFKEISVKSFGITTSDPFQLQLSLDGPKTNIVDLGYGTSQILPILHDVFRAPEGSRFLIQQPEVHLHPKAQAALGQYFVEAFVDDGKNFVIETHSDFILDRIRNSISEKKISVNDVSVLFFRRRHLENEIIPIDLDDMGDPVSPPDDYRSFFIDEQLKILGV